jgi:hypothetical protein
LVNLLTDKAREFIEDGNFQVALDILWESIDSGSSSTRLDLGRLFDEAGLHAFSQDQYLSLMESKAPESEDAAMGVFQNLVWMRDYRAAAKLTKEHKRIQNLHGDFAIESEQEYSTLRFLPGDYSGLISQLLFDRQANLFSIESDESLNSLHKMIVIDENLFNIACDLSFGNSAAHSDVSVDLPMGSGASVPRKAIDAVGEPLDRARNYLSSCSNLIAELSSLGDIKGDEPLLVMACKKGKAISNKLVLLQEEFTLSVQESQHVNNICWGLLKSDDYMEKFSGFVLGGITN